MMSFAVLTLLKATVVFGAAFFLARLCRRTRASVRHMVFALAFVALVAIPANFSEQLGVLPSALENRTLAIAGIVVAIWKEAGFFMIF